jgi:predicted metal-dependent peptidase
VTGIDTDRLAAAKLWLTSGGGDSPYLSTAVYALHTVSCVDVDTMTCDERWRLYVNPAWLAQTSVPAVATQLAHLVWHLLSDHAGRATSLQVTSTTSKAWRTACDVTVAETLDGSGLTDHHLPRPSDHRLAAHRPAEEHYARLSRLATTSHADDRSDATAPPDDGCGSAADARPRRYEHPDDADLPSTPPVAADEIRRRVAIEFRRHVTSRGTQPAEALRWAAAILEPVVRWQDVLTAAVRRAAGWANGFAEYTYTRPSRRQSAVHGVVLPATRRPLPTVAIVVDTSGSVDDGMLGQALGEVDGAIAGLGVPGHQVSVISCDAAVAATSTVRRAADVRLAGGGGTDMRAGIAAAQGQRPRPDVVVVLTDGYTPWPNQPPGGMAIVTALLRRDGTTPPRPPAWAQVVDCVMA